MDLATIVEVATQLKAEGQPVSQRAVLRRAGGSKRDMQKHWPAVLAALGEPPPAPTVEAQLASVQAQQRELQSRHGALQALALNQPLSGTEVAELLITERQLQGLAPIVARLQRATERAQQHVDIEAVVQAWMPLVEQKRRNYEAFVAELHRLRGLFSGLMAVHAQQEDLIATLPRAAQVAVDFPDSGITAQRILGRLPMDLSWLRQPATLGLIDLEHILDIDPGSAPLNERVLARFREED